MLKSSNTLISVSEIEKCLIIAGLISIKGQQSDDSYKVFIQKLIDKVCVVDNR